LTSLNRYERKKDIGLALGAFSLLTKSNPKLYDDVVLVVAGGYDTRVDENVEHHTELVALAEKLQISGKIVFLRSISNDQRLLLLQNTDLLLYTPQNEHFGIVPVEAMHLRCVVLACNSGGPLESIGQKPATSAGFLLEPKAEVWADKIAEVLKSANYLEDLKKRGK